MLEIIGVKEFVGTSQQIKEVLGYSEIIYRYMANKFPHIRYNDIHRRGLCIDINYELAYKLIRVGYSSKTRFSWKPIHLHVDLGNGWMSDATWQQFLPEDIKFSENGFPRVLIAQIPNLPNVLPQYGIPEDLFHVWTDAIIDSI